MCTVEGVVVGEEKLVDWDGEHMTLIRMELHQPVPFPLADVVDVFLHFCTVVLCLDDLLDDAVVCEETDGAVLSSRWQVVYVDEE